MKTFKTLKATALSKVLGITFLMVLMAACVLMVGLGAALAAGTAIQRPIECFGDVCEVTVDFTGDAANGSVPVFTIDAGSTLTAIKKGHVLYKVAAIPGALAPTAGSETPTSDPPSNLFDVTINDRNALALDDGLLANITTAAPTEKFPTTRRPINGKIVITTTNQAQAGAKWILRLTFWK
jgi:hypothetical protein